MNDDAFPKVTMDQLEGDTDGLFGHPWPDVERDAAIYTIAHEAEEECPGFIRDDLQLEAAHICACIDHGVWLAINEPIGPSPEWLAARIVETGGKC